MRIEANAQDLSEEGAYSFDLLYCTVIARPVIPLHAESEQNVQKQLLL